MSKITENKQLLHIIGESIVIFGVCYYFSSKIKVLHNYIDELTNKIEEYEESNLSLQDTIKNLTNRIVLIENKLNLSKTHIEITNNTSSNPNSSSKPQTDKPKVVLTSPNTTKGPSVTFSSTTNSPSPLASHHNVPSSNPPNLDFTGSILQSFAIPILTNMQQVSPPPDDVVTLAFNPMGSNATELTSTRVEEIDEDDDEEEKAGGKPFIKRVIREEDEEDIVDNEIEQELNELNNESLKNNNNKKNNDIEPTL